MDGLDAKKREVERWVEWPCSLSGLNVKAKEVERQIERLDEHL